MLKACLNGARTPTDHPAVPTTPAALAADAARCAVAGADAVHLHPRDHNTRETLSADHVAAAVSAVRRACPHLPIGVTTGAWIEPDPAARLAAIRAWTVLPDFASVNVHEDGAAEVAALLAARGVGIEAGVWTVDAADRYLTTWNVPVLRILVECMEPDPAAALANAAAVLAALTDRHPILLHAEGPATWPVLLHAEGPATWPVLLHAEGPATWPVLREAVRLGLHTRIGLEDTLLLPDGTPTPGNAALITAATIMRAAEPRSSPTDLSKIGGNPRRERP